MFKLRVKKKEVSTYNNKVVSVRLKCQVDQNLGVFQLDTKIVEWLSRHPSLYRCPGEWLDTFIFEGKAKCSDNDTFDLRFGERIAECRAKIKAYRFMCSYLSKLCKYYSKFLMGNKVNTVNSLIVGAYVKKKVKIFKGDNTDSLTDALGYYVEKGMREKEHLKKLLEET